MVGTADEGELAVGHQTQSHEGGRGLLGRNVESPVGRILGQDGGRKSEARRPGREQTQPYARRQPGRLR
jgi:hypothetical protein